LTASTKSFYHLCTRKGFDFFLPLSDHASIFLTNYIVEKSLHVFEFAFDQLTTKQAQEYSGLRLTQSRWNKIISYL